jgi:hypothetical protein
MNRPRALTPDTIARLTATTEPWLSCDDCFDDVDRVVEGVLTQTEPISERFRVHLRACSVCGEEASSLAALAAPDYGLDADAAAGLLDSVVHGANGGGAG